MGRVYEEIEGLDVFDIDNIVDDVCEVCFGGEGYHDDGCPLDPNNKFFDEEMEYHDELG